MFRSNERAPIGWSSLYIVSHRRITIIMIVWPAPKTKTSATRPKPTTTTNQQRCNVCLLLWLPLLCVWLCGVAGGYMCCERQKKSENPKAVFSRGVRQMCFLVAVPVPTMIPNFEKCISLLQGKQHRSTVCVYYSLVVHSSKSWMHPRGMMIMCKMRAICVYMNAYSQQSQRVVEGWGDCACRWTF